MASSSSHGWSPGKKHWYIGTALTCTGLLIASAGLYNYYAEKAQDPTVAAKRSGTTFSPSAPCQDLTSDMSWGHGPDRPTVGPSEYSPTISFNVERANPNYATNVTLRLSRTLGTRKRMVEVTT